MLNSCIDNVSMLCAISVRSTDLYALAMERMIDYVNKEVSGRPDVQELIGHNPVQMIETNNQEHAQFILTVFRLNAFDLLVRTIPWFYRVYHSRGFSYDYFLIELQCWRKTILDNLANDAREIVALYDWMISQHENMIELSVSGEILGFSLPDNSDKLQRVFTEFLLNIDQSGCLKLVEQSVTKADNLLNFYENVARHALYTVGTLWERNEMSIAEEHLATAIVGRIMSFLYCRFIGTPKTTGTAVVSAVPNEFHEVGARMAADILELDGWEVIYLGVNTPLDELINLLKQKQPFLLALSVATALNLEKTKEAIAAVKAVPELISMKILVGGLAFSNLPRLWQEFGADGYAADLMDVTAQCDAWWEAA